MLLEPQVKGSETPREKTPESVTNRLTGQHIGDRKQECHCASKLASRNDMIYKGRACATMSGNSRSRGFPGIPASNSRPESREWNFPLPIPFPKMGMEFFTLIPVPENGNGILWNFHSRSRYREWNIKVGKSTFFRDILYFRQSKSKYMIQHQRIIVNT